MDKKRYFEYLLDSLLRHNNSFNNDFSKLKVMKLLFLVVAADTAPFASGLLLKTFDDFKAYPLGPVEDEIYKNIKDDALVKFEINNKCLIVKPNESLRIEPDRVTDAIDKAINTLFSFNPNILNLKAWDLVDITHKYSSWNYAFNQYQSGGEYVRMEEMYIQNDIKYFK